MSKRSSRVVFSRDKLCLGFCILGVLLMIGSAGRAEDLGSRPPSWEPRVPIGKLQSAVGSLLMNEEEGQAYQTVGEGGEIHSRDLLVCLPGLSSEVETSVVRLTLWGNLPELMPFSGLQSSVVLHDSRAFDLDFTLHQGRVVLTNNRDKGAARVWVRVEGAAFQLSLHQPGDAICLALSSFWPRGVPFTPSPKKTDVPAKTLNFVVIQGRVSLTVSGTQHLLTAPPGPASFRWDSVNGPAEGTSTRRDLPVWANLKAKAPPQAKPYFEVIDKYKAEVKTKEPRTALFDSLAAANTTEDKEAAKTLAEFAIYGLAAINDIDRVMQSLSEPQNAQARRIALLALRHWIGDAAGRDQLLYQFLIDRLRYTKNEAATVLQLLHNALAAEDPDTYETLIAYLRHDKLTIRELAWWHLSRFVPEDMLVPYDPAGTPAQRAKAYAAWKELIPSGSLPTRKPKRK